MSGRVVSSMACRVGLLLRPRELRFSHGERLSSPEAEDYARRLQIRSRLSRKIRDCNRLACNC
jgi:hypothetical protein